MLSRLHIKDFSTVGHYLGLLLVITGASMFAPALVGAVFGEYSAAVHYFFAASVTLVVGCILRFFKARRLDRRRSLILCGVGWVAVALFAAIPLYLEGGFSSFLSAFFDSVSALTSTGVTCLRDVDHMSCAQASWRTLLSLGGGQAIIIIALYLGFFGDGGYSARDNARARQESSMASLRSMGTSLWGILVGVTAVGTIVLGLLLMRDGMPWQDAIMNGFWLSGNAFSTGSFIPHASSLIYYHSTGINGFVGVLMIMGSLNFVFLAMVMSPRNIDIRHMMKNSELRSYALWLFILVVAVTIIICRDNVYTSLAGLFNHSTFMVITAATTSGMQTVYPGQMGVSFGGGALILIMAAMFIGGCSCSTAGGLKMFRALQVLRWFGLSIWKSLVPSRVQVNSYYNHFGRKIATSGDALIGMVITTLFVAGAALGTAFFIAHGYDALDSICLSISFVTNTGVSISEPVYEMGADLKIVSMLLMWAGRLEFVALIAAAISLLSNLIPQTNRVPNGVTSTRKAQRKERRSARWKRIKVILGSNITKVVPLLVVASLTCCMLSAPIANAASSGEVSASDLPKVELSRGYRVSTISELLTATDRMSSEYVQISGEVIGYKVAASEGKVWLNIRDDEGDMIAVLASESQAGKIGTYGGYCSTGDVITVKGSYHRVCKSHGDELDVHAIVLTVSQPGSTWTLEMDDNEAIAGIALVILAVMLAFAERIWRGKPRLRLFRRK